MAYTRVLIDEELHKKMKELAGPEKGAIINEYREAIKKHIEAKTQKNIIQDSGLDIYLNERLNKMDNHLGSMLGRTGIDVSMTLMGVIILLEKLTKVDREKIQYELRKLGAKYFTTAIKEDKSNKASEKKEDKNVK